MKEKGKPIVVLMIMVSFFLVSTPYAATPDYEFYKGKVINYIVATKPGGGYDAYARLIAKHMEKFIPGVTMIIRNIPGAGHIIGANETFHAKPDGLTIGTFNTGLIYSQIVGQSGIRFDLTKYSWVGKANSEMRVLIVGQKTPHKTIQELIQSKEPIKMPCAGIGSQDYNETLILSEAFGANFKPVPGYAGREGEMAILRGEVVGMIGSYTGLLTFIKAEGCRILLQFGSNRYPLSGIPTASEQNLSPKAKSLVQLANNICELGRLTGAPPGVPPQRLEVLREAYKKTLTSPELLKAGEKMGLTFDPEYGEDVAKMMREAINQPEENMAMLKKIIKVE